MKLNKRRNHIASMFDAIAPRYDALNHILSLNIDKKWRVEMMKVLPSESRLVLDVATGTGDLAIAIAAQRKDILVEGIDISKNMLSIGQQKVERSNLLNKITLKQKDCTKLDYPNEFFDVVTCAFGVRNFEDFGKGIQEMYRVTKYGGRILILEFSLPKYRLVRWLYYTYFYMILPLVGFLVSQNIKAYTYLPMSVKNFPSGNQMVEYLSSIGIDKVRYTPLSLGIATLYQIYK